jgi:hypothetical protein
MNTTNEILKNLQAFDSTIVANIKTFLTGYALNDPRLVIKYDTILFTIRFMVYDLFVILITSILKVLHKDDFLVSTTFIISLVLLAGGAFLVFLGFFQILF